MCEKRMTRRQFLKRSAVIASAALLSPYKSNYGKTLTAVDQVVLGKTGLKLSRLGIGTGSVSGNVQRALGHEGFNRLIRYAYDQGITYIDTADSYKTHTWIREAIRDLPREKLFIMTKMFRRAENPMDTLDRFRMELNMDYIDCLLIHCTVSGNWDENSKPLMDALEEAKQKQIIRSHGVSCHSLPATKKAATIDWVDVNLVRINPQGSHIDTSGEIWNAKSNASHLPPVLKQLKIMRKKRHGIVGMKIIGEGDFTNPEDRKKSIHYAMQPGLTDAIVIGFKSTSEIDEAILNMNTALAERK